MKVGVLALQGDVRLHTDVLNSLGIKPTNVTIGAQIDELSHLIIPGGESTTISKLLSSGHIFDKLQQRLEDRSISIFGTCAGLILLAKEVLDGRDDQKSFGVLDVSVRRNAFGRQIESDLKEVVLNSINVIEPAFIRAPRIERVGKDVETIGRLKESDEPVLVRQGKILAATFHPELCVSQDCNIVHKIFLEIAEES